MKKILFVNELGGGLTHGGMLRQIANRLATMDSFECRFLLREWQRAEEFGLPASVVRPAPKFEGRTRPDRNASNFGEIIWEHYLRDPEVARQTFAAWDAELAQFQPDLVVTDYAPFCQMVSYGKCPVVAVGNGYSLPPAKMDRFMEFVDGRKASAKRELQILEVLNKYLSRSGVRQKERLPEICAADRSFIVTVPPFDPYLPDREKGAHIGITYAGGAPWPAPTTSRAIAYFHAKSQQDTGLFRAFANSGYAFDLHIGAIDETFEKSLLGLPITPFRKPFELKSAMPGKSVALHMGGPGFALAAFFAGVPQVIMYTHQDNQFIGRVVAGLGAGICMPYRKTTGDALEETIRRVGSSSAFRQAAFEAGRKLASYRDCDTVGRIAAGATELLAA